MAMFSSTSMMVNAVLVATSIASSGALRERDDNDAKEKCIQKAADRSNNFFKCYVKSEATACSKMDETPTPTKEFDGCCCVDTFDECGGEEALASNTTKFAYSDCKKPEEGKCLNDNMKVKKADKTELGCCCTITDQQVSTSSTSTSKTGTSKT